MEKKRRLEYVGKIEEITGPLLKFTRRFSSGQQGVFKAYAGMPVFIDEILQTDEVTTAVVKLFKGGRISMGTKQRAAVVSPERMRDITPAEIGLTMCDLSEFESADELYRSTS